MDETNERTLVKNAQKPCPNKECKGKGKVTIQSEGKKVKINCPDCGGAGKINKTEKELKKEKKDKKEK